LPTWVLVILAARNVNFCSTGALTEEVLAVVESELSKFCWLGLSLPVRSVATGVYTLPKSVQVNFLWGKNDVKAVK